MGPAQTELASWAGERAKRMADPGKLEKSPQHGQTSDLKASRIVESILRASYV